MGANLVKRNLDPAEKTDLEKAGEAQDKFVLTLGDVVMRQLAGILEDEETDAVARVSAGKAILEWIRPKKNGVQVNVNTGPSYTSHLNLPAPQAPPVDDAIEVKVYDVPKLLPEPQSPMVAGKLTQRTDFSALRELEAAHAPAIAPSDLHRERNATPRTPDQPERASNVKMFR